MILHATELGEGAPLVLLHGLFGSARNFGAVQRRLAQGRRVIAVDLRNHGASPHAADMRYRKMAEDVLETLAQRDAMPATLLGHSMGGKVAMLAALTRPDSVSRLIVCDIAPLPYRHANAAIAEAMQAMALPPGLTRAAADAALSAAVPDASVRGFLLQNLSIAAQPVWRIGLDEIAAAMPVIEGWDDVRATYEGPVLFIAGAASDYIRAEHRPAIRRLFPKARFVTLKGAGHWLHADNPDGFVAVVEAFLTAS